MQIPAYCRAVEAHLCRRNGGHLIRVVGPAFEMVASWASAGIPLNIAFSGIDRCVQRLQHRTRRRRPVPIGFCEADVLDAFDEWRHALGLTAAVIRPATTEQAVSRAPGEHRTPSLPAHLERVLTRLSSARVAGVLDSGSDELIDRVAEELEHARRSSRGLRGDARRALVDRLTAIDQELLSIVRHGLDEKERAAMEREADEELAAFRTTMSADAYRRARTAAFDRLLRSSRSLPTITPGLSLRE